MLNSTAAIDIFEKILWIVGEGDDGWLVYCGSRAVQERFDKLGRKSSTASAPGVVLFPGDSMNENKALALDHLSSRAIQWTYSAVSRLGAEGVGR